MRLTCATVKQAYESNEKKVKEKMKKENGKGVRVLDKIEL